MGIVAAKCTQCGAILEVDSDKDAWVCDFCSMPFVTEKAVANYNITNNIAASVVNISPAYPAFEIRAGVLEAYHGAEVDVAIPEGVIIIEKSAFEGAYGLTSVAFPESLIRIEDEAFANCPRLARADLSNAAIKHIGIGSFSGCESLEYAHLPQSLSYLGAGAFENCASLKQVILPNSLSILAANCFAYCSSLAAIDLPSSLLSVSKGCFCGCHSLEELALPGFLVSIGESAFKNCTNLKLAPGLPSSLAEIGDAAFCNCIALKAINFPRNLTAVGSYAFLNCSSLVSIAIGNPRTNFGRGVFEEAANLSSVTINAPYHMLAAFVDEHLPGTEVYEKQHSWKQKRRCRYCGSRLNLLRTKCTACSRRQ
ncbi:MAG: leucine-rich repeat domain-containing protein [Eubacteriaceae bacterium]|nr:leucine-rich repeat domain-containing protein [Eubacteriaceae bacterium]